MTFASDYLAKGALFPQLTLQQPPIAGLGIIVVIPAFDEPGIGSCLESLARCKQPDTATEVIVVVNAPLASGDKGVEANKRTAEAVEGFRASTETFFRLLVIDAGLPAIKGWGVGAARKAGMDEAIRRFEIAGNPQGVIASLDADCIVSEDYLMTVWKEFGRNTMAGGCSLGFRHRDDEPGLPPAVVTASRKYELHLRYFVAALRYTSFPYAYHTIGSAFAVRALRYVRAGGMSRKQGGEDFYFIQKLVVSDDFLDLRKVLVYPSSRLSERVPFGTGPSLIKMIKSGDVELRTYNPGAFNTLRDFFSQVRGNLEQPVAALPRYEELSPSVKHFTDAVLWHQKCNEILNNTSDGPAALKRFFNWFNSFMIVKFLNHVHEPFFERIEVEKAAVQLITMAGLPGKPVSEETLSLLGYYRMVDSL